MAVGAGGGVPIGSYKTPSRSPMLSSLYDTAVTQNAEDYDRIMGNYDDLLQSSKQQAGANKLTYSPISAKYGQQYSSAPNVNSAISGLQNIASTGGYSEGDIGALRERSISPIRAIYANQMRELGRRRVLQGGYAPGEGAARAKMARELSGTIGDRVTDVNARLAESINANKMNALSTVAPLAQRESELIHTSNQDNVNEDRRVAELNKTMEMRIAELNEMMGRSNANTQLNAIGGQASLYGTTPALSSMFAQQALANNQQNLQATQIANSIKNQRAGVGLNLVGQSRTNSGPGARGY